MTRDREHAGQNHNAAPLAQPDFDAEHDPDVSRRASLAGLRAVQKKAAGGASTEATHAAADRGVASPTTALPFADKIQASFGADHDVSSIKAHVGGNAAASMGASAFAAGNHVVFDRSPDLHTAAHEAAHVVQQAKGVNLYGGVGEAGDAYEQHADAVADRVVSGQSAGDLLKAGPGGAAPGIQQAPITQSYADQSAMQAIQSHMDLTVARMYAASSNVFELVKMPTGGDAGMAPMLMQLQAQVDAVENDLDNLASEINRVPNIMHNALDEQARKLRGAIHGNFGWARALNTVYSLTHDAAGNLITEASGMKLGITATQQKIAGIFQTLGIDDQTIGITQDARYGKEDAAAEGHADSLVHAEIEALKNSMWSVDVAVDLINADLHSSVQDQGKEATDLLVSVLALVNVLEPIDPSHIGKVAKLPLLLKKVEAMQAEVMKMKEAGDDKGKALAPRLGYGTALSTHLHRITVKLGDVKTVNAANAKHHH